MGVSHETLPVASAVAGIDTTVLLASAAILAAGVNIRKLTPYLHETIGPEEVGVVLENGKPVPRKVLTDDQITSRRGQRRDRKGSVTTELRLAGGDSPYIVRPPNFYWVRPFRTLERVYTSDQVSKLGFDLMSQEMHLTHVEADVTWNISALGENPIHSITRIKHIKQNKKDIEDSKHENGESHYLASQILSIGAAALGRVLTGRTMRQLQYLNRQPEYVTKCTIDECAKDIGYYGVQLSAVRLMPITWKDNETIAQAIRTLSGNVTVDEIVNVTAEVADPYSENVSYLTIIPGGDPVPAA